MKFLRLVRPHHLLPYLLLLVVVIVSVVFWPAKTAKAPVTKPAQQPTQPITSTRPVGLNKQLYSIDSAASLWVVVNKGRVLPSNYVPASFGSLGLRQDASLALSELFKAAKQAGLSMSVTSGYRSYANQQATYNNYVKQFGQSAADTFSARPGHSEHQTGLAADVQPLSGKCALDQCFAATPEGQWLSANAYKYGFIIRYQKNTQSLTGYEYEPWHIRYVGKALAAELHKSGQTLEQFFGLPIYTDYPKTSLTLK